MRILHLLAAAIVFSLHGVAAAQDRPRLPQGPAGTVTLTVADYDRLIDRAALPRPPADAPPLAAVVARADLRARVIGDTARGTLHLEGEVFGRGHVKVPLVSRAMLVDARADGRALPLLHEGDSHAAVLPGPGPFSITMDWAVPLAAAPGRVSFVLPVPAAGTSTATLDLPGDPPDVRVEPGAVTRRQSAGGRTLLQVTLEAGKSTEVSWSVRETVPVAPVETRTLADVKSLLTVGEAELRLVSLIDITVVRGEPRSFALRVPSGFQLVSATGPSLDTTTTRDDVITLTPGDTSLRRHQFLVSFERPHEGGSFKVETALPALAGSQREVGQTAIEAIGTVDINAAGEAGLQRMDVREVHSSLRSLARQPLLAAFRFQRRENETRILTLDVKRFDAAPVIAAAAEHAMATSLVTVEGRMLTEIQLTLRNRAQAFMKVTLPSGATMLSAEVAGETVKPAVSTDGIRVPLLRPGVRPDGPYTVSFVYLHAGPAFVKRGDAHMVLPAMDVPVSVLEWELFLPDQYALKPTSGNVIPAHLLNTRPSVGFAPAAYSVARGQIVGRITDASGAVLPGATVSVTAEDGVRRTTTANGEGAYVVTDVPSGRVVVRAELSGFGASERSFVFDQRPRQVDFELRVGTVSETVEVRADAPYIDDKAAQRSAYETLDADAANARGRAALPNQAPSQNVLNLQRRVAGVLPVRVDVPRSGTAYRFVRPLVLSEETSVTFRYKRR